MEVLFVIAVVAAFVLIFTAFDSEDDDFVD